MKFFAFLFALLLVAIPAMANPAKPYITGCVSGKTSAASPVEFIIQDSQGRRLGFDKKQKAILNEIPNGVHYHNIQDNEQYDGESICFEISNLMSGALTFTVHGLKKGAWKMDMKIVDPSKGYGSDSEKQLTFSGDANPSSKEHFTVQVP